MLENLKASGMTAAKAREMLKVWGELGAKDSKQLRQLLVRKSMQPLKSLAIQTALDFTATLGGLYCGHLIGESDPFPGQFFVSLLAYFVGCYYAITFFLELSALSSVLLVARRYSADSETLLAAVQQLAGPVSGLSLVDRVALAANTFQVIQALESISRSLKELAADDASPGGADTLSNLSAYLTLQRAEEVYGFDPERYGMSEAEAVRIAGVFSRFDVNGDGKLELAELRSLCYKLGKELSEAELREAIRILDATSSGYLYFTDFVEWWVGNTPSRQVVEEAAASNRAGASAGAGSAGGGDSTA